MSVTLTKQFNLSAGSNLTGRLFTEAGEYLNFEIRPDEFVEEPSGTYSLSVVVSEYLQSNARKLKIYADDGEVGSDLTVVLTGDDFSNGSGGGSVGSGTPFQLALWNSNGDGLGVSRIKDTTGSNLDIDVPLHQVKIGDINNQGNNISFLVTDQQKRIQGIFNGGSCDFIGANTRFTINDAGGTIIFRTSGGNNQGIDFDCGQGSVMFGDLEGQANNTRLVLDDSEQTIALEAANGATLNGNSILVNTVIANTIPKSDGENLVASRITDGATLAIELGGDGHDFNILTNNEFTTLVYKGTDTFAGSQFEANANAVYLGDHNEAANATQIYLDDSLKKIELEASTESVTVDGIAHSITVVATLIKLIGLPSADPHVAGALYTTLGALMVSAG